MHPLQKRAFGRASPQPNEVSGGSEPIYIYDRRQHLRTHVLQQGKLAFGHADFAIDCFIHDISMGGARIRVPGSQKIPDTVILVHLRDRIAYEASVAWRKDDGTLGLKFLVRHELEEARSPGLKSLLRHCVEYSLR
jgi:PilZ domain-containing protein